MRYACLLRFLVALTLFPLFAASAARAEDAFFDLSIDHLNITEGKLPKDRAADDYRNFEFRDVLRAYVVIDGPGEAYAVRGFQNGVVGSNAPENHVLIRLPEKRDVTGRLYVENDDGSAMVEVKFKAPASDAKPQSREAFYRTMENHYENLLSQGCPGAAWFRLRAREAHKALGGKEEDNTQRFPVRPSTLDDTYSLFSGNQALAENLQLDKALPAGAAAKGEKDVDADSIKGINVAAIDWKQYITDKNPATDPLAAAIPADQHAIFFHNFESLLALADEADRSGTPVLQAAESRSEDAGTRQRYERQLGLSLTGLGRLLGPHLVKSVAITGSDPYLRGGSDLAILFEPKGGDALKSLLTAQITAAGQLLGARQVDGKAGSLQFTSVRSPDRALSSYLAVLSDGTVIVTNSEAQLARLAAVADGKAAPLSKAPEYIFFRDRYKLGEGEESALLVLSDATIRRWCSARWRIADSRRTRATAVMTDLNARNLNALVAGKIAPGPIHGEFPVPGLDDLQLTPRGVVSSTYGSLGFLTPISEMKLDKVTEGEAQAYGRWRDMYESNWRGFFDPIAIQLFVSPKKLAADVTVMPLIAGSQYQQFVDLTRGAKISATAGDPHDCVFRVGMALDMNSQTMKTFGQFATQMAPNVKIDPLGWVGQSIWYYGDQDPFWAEAIAAANSQEFLQKNMGRMPIALHVEVANPFKLAGFLVAAHAYVDQTVPGMTVWENRTYKDQAYVRISPSEQLKTQTKELKDAALYYRATGDSLLITLSEPLLKRAIDRQLERQEARNAGKPLPPAGQPALGTSLVMQADSKGFESLRNGGGFMPDLRIAMQKQSWSNLPILNEWRHRYPDQDPLKIYEQYFHARLLDPAGGQYLWNEKWQTMESTVYGSPAEPKKGPAGISPFPGLLRANVGLTFEDAGLRAMAVMEREAK